MGNLCCQEDDSKKKSQRTSKRQSNTHTSNLKKREQSDSQTTEKIQFQKHGPENYQSIKYLGRGTFGDVVLAEDKQTMKQYAMKIIDKRKIKQLNVFQCKLIKKISQMELFVTIKETFQNESKIYIVMQYHQKGDIYYYLRRKEYIFHENIIRNLLSEIIVGIQILHREGIIYRQLKPQNILVTDQGHVRLTDYGLSKMIIEEKSLIQTFIGTLQYTAPEVFKGNYGKQVDLWAIGILVCELKFQKNPFQNCPFETVLTIEDNIQKTSIEQFLNKNIGKISQQLRDLLIRLLQKNPKNRISIPQLKSHSFFEGIVWEDVIDRKNAPALEEFLTTNSIKFRDPMEGPELSHRKLLDNKNKDFTTNLYEFRSSQ